MNKLYIFSILAVLLLALTACTISTTPQTTQNTQETIQETTNNIPPETENIEINEFVEEDYVEIGEMI